MIKTSQAILYSLIGGFAAVSLIILLFGWGVPHQGQKIHIDPSRSDYVDLLLTLVTVVLAAIGLAITIGALVIGLVAFKTLKEIKEEASQKAESAAEKKINTTMQTNLAPSVRSNLDQALPNALRKALLDEKTGHAILNQMAKDGELDEVLERVVVRLQSGGGEIDPNQYE